MALTKTSGGRRVTPVGAEKSALNRARAKVKEPSWSEHEAASPGVLNEFCSAFNARDLNKIVSLLLETAHNVKKPCRTSEGSFREKCRQSGCKVAPAKRNSRMKPQA
jgi:hypothetical protein